ncbi:MAG: hypothetical protein Q9224_005835, partial [Gallowayella concinna]
TPQTLREDEPLILRQPDPTFQEGARLAKRDRDDELEEEEKELHREQNSLEESVGKAKKRVRLHASFDSEYWTNMNKLATTELALNEVKRKRSMRSMQVMPEEWSQSETGRQLLIQQETTATTQRLALKQLHQSQEFAKTLGTQKAFAELFIGSPLGWNFKSSRGPRTGKEQSAFRKDLIDRQKCRHPDPEDVDALWCPITKIWWSSNSMVAGHLFPARAGPEAMEAIFGEQDTSELFKAENGILWVKHAEDRFSAGHFCIVPDVPNEPTSEDITKWEALERIATVKKRWVELDGERLTFRGNFRPRARYLYFSYCQAMLRESYACKRLGTAKRERGGLWGVPSRYISRSILRGFIEAMGDDYAHVLEGGLESAEEDDGKADVRGMMLANEDIQANVEKRDIEECDELADVADVADEDVETDTTDDEEEAEEEIETETRWTCK